MIKKNFLVIRGTEFRIACRVTINGDPDLTGYTPGAHVRRSPDANEIVAEFTFEPGELDDTGIFDALLGTNATQAVNAGKYFYDIRLVKDGKPLYIAFGTLEFQTPVTRA